MPTQPSLPSSLWPPRDELVRRWTDELIAAVAASLDLPQGEVSARASAAIAEVLRAHVENVERRLIRADRLAVIGQLSAGVAHELRNPLSVIETSAFILAECGRADERIARHTRRIAEQVAIASGVVGDLLEAARDRPIVPAPVDVPQVARAAVAQVPRPALATIALDVPPTLPPVAADERRLRQVLTNLVTNALDATEGRGRITVSARAEAGHVRISVIDDGPGIPPAHLPRLFDPLFTTKAQGTGLGLALSREIVRALGGDLAARNEPGAGARFDVTLPVAKRGTEDLEP